MATDAQSLVNRSKLSKLTKSPQEYRAEIADSVERNRVSTMRAKNPKGEVRLSGMDGLEKGLRGVNTQLDVHRRQSLADTRRLQQTFISGNTAIQNEQARLRKLFEDHYRELQAERRKQIRADEEARRLAQHALHQPGLNNRYMHAGYYEPPTAIGQAGSSRGGLLQDLFDLWAAKKSASLLTRGARAAASMTGSVLRFLGKAVKTVGLSEATGVAGGGMAMIALDNLLTRVLPKGHSGDWIQTVMSGKNPFVEDHTGEVKQNKSGTPSLSAQLHQQLVAKENDADSNPNVPIKPSLIPPNPQELTSPTSSSVAQQVEQHEPEDLRKRADAVGGQFVQSFEHLTNSSTATVGNVTLETMDAIEKKYREFLGLTKMRDNWVKPPLPDNRAKSVSNKDAAAQNPTPETPPTPPTPATPPVTPPDLGKPPAPASANAPVAKSQALPTAPERLQAGMDTMHSNPLASVFGKQQNSIQLPKYGPPASLAGGKPASGGSQPGAVAQKAYGGLPLPSPSGGADISAVPSALTNGGVVSQGPTFTHGLPNPSSVPTSVQPSLMGAQPVGLHVGYNAGAPMPYASDMPQPATMAASGKPNDVSAPIVGNVGIRMLNMPNLGQVLADKTNAITPPQPALPDPFRPMVSQNSQPSLQPGLFDNGGLPTMARGGSNAYESPNIPMAPAPPPPDQHSDVATPEVQVQKEKATKTVVEPSLSSIPQNTTDRGLHSLQTTDDQ